MTKQEILNSLEALKDNVNDGGKRTIDGLKAAVSQLTETAATEEPKREKKDEEAEAEDEEEEEEKKEKGKKEEPKAKAKVHKPYKR